MGISKDINRVFLIVFLAGLTLSIYIPAASANTVKQFNVEVGDAYWYDLTVNASETVDVSVWTDGAPNNNDILITSSYDSIGNQMNAGTATHGKATFGSGFTPTTTSTFKVRVYLYDSDRVGTRTITMSSPQFIFTAPHYMETASNIAEGDTIWYYLTVNSTGIVGINAWTDGGDLEYDRFELYLFDPIGKEVYTTSGSNKASITYIAKTTGIFKVQVHINKIRGGNPHKITVSSNYPLGATLPTSTPTISETYTPQKATPQPSIVIDGNPQDWAGIKPIMTDPEGDRTENVQGSDLKSLYALNDNEFLYLMLEVYDNPNGSKEKVQYVFEIANNTVSPFLKWDYEIGAEAQGNPWLWNLTEYDTRINDKDPNPYGLVRGVSGVEALGKDVFEMKIPLRIIGNLKNMIIRARTQFPNGNGLYDDMPGAKFITNPSLIIPEKQTPTPTLTPIPTHGEELNQERLSEGLKYLAFPALTSLAVLGIVLFFEKREKNKRKFNDDLRTKHWFGYYSVLIGNFIIGAVFALISFAVFYKELPVSYDAGKFFFTIPIFYLSASTFILIRGLLLSRPNTKLNGLHFLISLLMGIFMVFILLTDPQKSPPFIFPVLFFISSGISLWYERVAIFRPESIQESLSIEKGSEKPILAPDIKRGYSVLPNNDIKFGIRVTNNTSYTITDVDTILDYQKASSMPLFSMKDSEIQHLGNIAPNTARTATYILKPLGCIHNEQINALIICKDHMGKKQTLHMHPKEVHCVCPFLKEKPMNEGEYSRLAANSKFVQEGISFKGISVEELANFMGETCRHMLYKVKEYDIEGKKVIYLSGESLGEKTYYLLTAVIQEYKDLTQVVLRAYSDKSYGLNGFMNEMADSIRHLVGSVRNAKEIGIIENTQVINIIDSVVQRTNFEMGAGGNTQVNIRDSVVQSTTIKGEEKREAKARNETDKKAPEPKERIEREGQKVTPFEEIWSRIIVNSRELFHTKTGLEFTYKVEGDRFYPSRTEYAISKNDFKTAYELVPIDGPGEINDIVRGPAYVWAVLHDQRILMKEW